MKRKPIIKIQFLPLITLGIAMVGYLVYSIIEKLNKKPTIEEKPSVSELIPVMAATNSSTTTPLSNTPTVVSMSAQSLANGNVQKFVVPVSILIGEHYDFKIKTDLSSQSNIAYTILGVEQNNELTVQISNNTGSNIVTLPIQISILKLT